MDQAPVMSVVVTKRLPESVFWAVTVTPGSGMFPLLTRPWRLPPVTAAVVSGGLAGAVGAAGGCCGAGGAGASAWGKGDCEGAAALNATHISIDRIPLMAARRIVAPGCS